MTYYILSQIEYHIRESNIKVVFDEKSKESKIYSLKKYLSKIKSLIDKHITDWDQIKKYTNPYEFVHTTIQDKKLVLVNINRFHEHFIKLWKFIILINY